MDVVDGDLVVAGWKRASIQNNLRDAVFFFPQSSHLTRKERVSLMTLSEGYLQPVQTQVLLSSRQTWAALEHQEV
jgi:hypothetical protein